RARTSKRVAEAAERRQAVFQADAHRARQAQASYGPQATLGAAPSSQHREIPSDWSPDPSHPSQIRYWNGFVWTDHVRPTHAVATTPVGWLPDTSDATLPRVWNGA